MDDISLLKKEDIAFDKWEDKTYWMTNYWPEETGLSSVIWISIQYPKKIGTINIPRIRVEKRDGNRGNLDWIIITVEDSPRELSGHLEPKKLKQVKEFIKLNKEFLIKFWNYNENLDWVDTDPHIKPIKSDITRIMQEERIFYENPKLLLEMANLRTGTTGLPMNIYASKKQAKHGCRIKIQKTKGAKITNDWMIVTVEDEPRVFGGNPGPKQWNLIKRFIELNKKALLDFWNGIINRQVFEKSIIPVKIPKKKVITKNKTS